MRAGRSGDGAVAEFCTDAAAAQAPRRRDAAAVRRRGAVCRPFRDVRREEVLREAARIAADALRDGRGEY
eukprot:gene27939-39727_t